ncbi:MAG: RagB/SusD family nutrient uptake outer membrane protein [Flavobacteriaceae bacterium]|nr:RagB/SusD family nutrient uptake outer membrane protein [Flavobacteriaceae bacterium]|tara:strand:+ start:2583 stop:4112 length:1530 start_codon:yes stop_codon:yes gene_type:complete
MKKIFRLSAVLTLLVLVSACEGDILNNSGVAGVSQPTTSLTSAQTEAASLTNPGIPAAFVNGIYGQMIQTGTGGTGGHDDFGHKSYHVFSDMMCGDMALSVSTYGWYRVSIAELGAMQDFTFGDNRQVWRYYYRIIRSANNVIQSLGGNDFEPALSDNKASMAQALTLRAHAYFYLTQFYQRKYVANEAILPLYTEPIGQNLPKSTAQEVYDRMIADLRLAIKLFGDAAGWTRSAPNQVNTYISHQILAMVLGAQDRVGNATEIASLTQAVINGPFSILPMTELYNGFNDINRTANANSWMWGIDITENNNLGLVSWWGQVDMFSYSYAWAGDYKAIDETLYNSMDATDARRGQFRNNPASGRHLQPEFKFWASNVIGGTSFTVTADYVYMRVEEAYLLNAEANATAGNDAAARTSLKALVSQRVANPNYIDALSGQALIDEIYKQTRLELWGEGKSFFALKRLGKTMVRGNNHLSLVGVPVAYDDERLQFEIPQDEIQNNPFVNDQNQ